MILITVYNSEEDEFTLINNKLEYCDLNDYTNTYILNIEYIENGIDEIYVKEFNFLDEPSYEIRNENNTWDFPCGPAVVDYYQNYKTQEVYYQNGTKHRENGPAQIYYTSTGQVRNKYFYIYGTIYSEEKYNEYYKAISNK